MSSIVIAGDTSGTVTLQAPAIAGTTVVDLPAGNGTLITTPPGTAGNVLTSNGTSWVSQAAAAFDAGTRLGFQQTTAPTGWTKDTTAGLNDSIMRIVTGSASSGGSTAFSTWAAVTSAGATTLATSQIPSHTHAVTAGPASFGGSYAGGGSSNQPYNSGATGGGSSHTHSLSQSLKYYDFIIASKN